MPYIKTNFGTTPSLDISHPHLLSQWNYEKNTRKPDELTHGSEHLAHWICDHRHQWEATVFNRARGVNDCLECRSLAFLSPELLSQWDYSKNTKDPQYLSAKSTYSAWWRCGNGHEWRSIVRERSQKNNGNCRKCLSIPYTHPLIAERWDHSKNQRDIYSITFGMSERIWLTCENQHSYQIEVRKESRQGNMCPKCLSVAHLYPEILEEWDYSVDQKNPFDVHCGSTYKVSLICSNGHKRKKEAREYGKNNQRSCKDCKSIVYTYPELISEWDWESNEKHPKEVSHGSLYRAHWRCSYGHRWQAIVVNRTGKRVHGCPYCSHNVSSPEKELNAFIVSLGFDTTVSSRKVIPPYEVDIYIPRENVAIEFNGNYWHSDNALMKRNGMTAREYHSKKREIAKETNTSLLFVWESDWWFNQEEVKDSISSFLSGSDVAVPEILSKTEEETSLRDHPDYSTVLLKRREIDASRTNDTEPG